MSDIATYNILKFKLTNFFDARIIEDEDLDGRVEKGVFIPLDKNGLVISKNNVVNAYAFVNKTFVASEEGWTHYLQLKARPEFVKKMNDLGYKKMPYLGNIKPASYQIKANIDRVKKYVPIERID